MSCTEIYGFDREGNAYWEADIKNAWRGSMAIWRIMEERHLPPNLLYGRPLSRLVVSLNAAKEVWALADNKEIPEHERIVMLTTMDKCLVKKENLSKVIEAFRKFEGVTSLPEQADILEQMMADDDCIAVGWNQTSINYSFWSEGGGYNEEADESIPYNCLTQNKHFWLFDDLNATEEG